MERLLELTDIEVRMGFVASCVEAALQNTWGVLILKCTGG